MPQLGCREGPGTAVAGTSRAPTDPPGGLSPGTPAAPAPTYPGWEGPPAGLTQQVTVTLLWTPGWLQEEWEAPTSPCPRRLVWVSKGGGTSWGFLSAQPPCQTLKPPENPPKGSTAGPRGTGLNRVLQTGFPMPPAPPGLVPAEGQGSERPQSFEDGCHRQGTLVTLAKTRPRRQQHGAGGGGSQHSPTGWEVPGASCPPAQECSPPITHVPPPPSLIPQLSL